MIIQGNEPICQILEIGHNDTKIIQNDLSNGDTLETLKVKLQQSEQSKEKIRSNLQKLKAKMVDSSALINLYNKTKESKMKNSESYYIGNRQTTVQLESSQKENLVLKDKLDSSLKEAFNLRDQISLLNKRMESMESDLTKKTSELNGFQVSFLTF